MIRRVFVLLLCICLPVNSYASDLLNFVHDLGQRVAGAVFATYYSAGSVALLYSAANPYTAGIINAGAWSGLAMYSWLDSKGKLSSNGDIGRKTQQIWVDLPDYHVKEKDVTTGVKWQDLQSMNLDSYPFLKSARDKSQQNYNDMQANGSAFAPPTKPYVKIASGHYWLVGSLRESYVVTTVSTPGVSYTTNAYAGAGFGIYYYKPHGDGRYDLWFNGYNGTDSGTNPPSPLVQPDKEQWKKELSVDGTGNPGDIADKYSGDIDNLITSNPNIVHVYDTDDPTGVGSAPELMGPPSGAATTAQIAARDGASGASSNSNTAAGSAGSAAGTAWRNYSSSGGHSNGVGGDPGLLKAWQDAQAAAAAAAANAAKDNLSNYVNPSLSAYGDGSSFDFGARITSFVNGMKTSSLFSLPSQVMGNIPSSNTSSYTISMGSYGNNNIDLANYSAALDIVKSVLQIIVGVYCVKILVLKGGSG